MVAFDTLSFDFTELKKARKLLGTTYSMPTRPDFTWFCVAASHLRGWCASASQQAWSACGGWPVGGELVIRLADRVRHTKLPLFSDRAPRGSIAERGI